jgi:hypothetical protein
MSIAMHETPHLRASYLAQTFDGGLIAGLIISSCLWWRFERRHRRPWRNTAFSKRSSVRLLQIDNGVFGYQTILSATTYLPEFVPVVHR